MSNGFGSSDPPKFCNLHRIGWSILQQCKHCRTIYTLWFPLGLLIWFCIRERSTTSNIPYILFLVYFLVYYSAIWNCIVCNAWFTLTRIFTRVVRANVCRVVLARLFTLPRMQTFLRIIRVNVRCMCCQRLFARIAGKQIEIVTKNLLICYKDTGSSNRNTGWSSVARR